MPGERRKMSSSTFSSSSCKSPCPQYIYQDSETLATLLVLALVRVVGRLSATNFDVCLVQMGQPGLSESLLAGTTDALHLFQEVSLLLSMT